MCYALVCLPTGAVKMHGCALVFLCHIQDSAHHGTDTIAALCLCSLLSSLRRLTLGRVKVSLPALQPIATRLHELNIHGSRLQGSAEGFLTKGWTALTSLALTNTRMEDATLSAALELPAVEGVDICWFEGHQGGELQIDQLIGSCPQISRLEFQLLWSQRLRQASRQSCTLVDFKRLVNLNIMSCSVQTNMDLDLPLSLTQLQFGGYMGGGTGSVDFFWALQEAVKCVRRGAQLHKLICHRTEAYLQPAQWGASLEDQHRRLGCQLSGLRELQVMGAQKELLSALGAVASAAPCLIRLEIETRDWDQKSNLRVNVSPICSATLESIRVTNCRSVRPDLPAPQVLLTLLPGCTRLQEVVVHFMGGPVEGAAVKIRCHSCSPRCTMPVVGHADDDHKVPEEVSAGAYNDVVVNFVRVACSEEGVRECTVLYACHAAGPEQAPLWGHAVMPGIL